MFTKSRSKKGFTLMEMLIVVAIIGVLVSVSFPVFNAQLETARVATDAANMRAAKAVAMAEYLTTGKAISAYYDADKGILVPIDQAKFIKPYGQSSIRPPTPEGGAIQPPAPNEDGIIRVNVNDETSGMFVGEWQTKPKK